MEKELSREDIAERFTREVRERKLLEIMGILDNLLNSAQEYNFNEVFGVARLIKFFEKEQETYSLSEELRKELDILYRNFIFPLISDMEKARIKARYPLKKKEIDKIRQLMEKMALELAQHPQILKLIEEDKK